MLELHHAPDNASLVLRLALEEAGVPYRAILVDRAARAHKAPEYLALNPAGLIPVLVTPHGPMAETAACLLWLSETYPHACLAPPPGDPARPAFLRWLFFVSNTLHADLIRLFHPDRYAPPEGIAAHHATTARHLADHLALLDRAAADAPALFAPPSGLGLYAAVLVRWAALYPVAGPRWLRLRDFPALQALARLVEARPAAIRAASIEGLGARPFSSPALPRDPAGGGERPG